MLKRFWNAPLTWGSVITVSVVPYIIGMGALIVWLGYPKKWYVSVKDKIVEKFKK